MKLSKIAPGSYAGNCYILSDEGEAVVIDPSAHPMSIIKPLLAEKLKLNAILLTHGHFDHMLGLEPLRAAFPDVPVMIHADDAELLSDGQKNASAVLLGNPKEFAPPDKMLISGDTIKVGKKTVTLIHTPGHTRGSVCYQVGNILFTGDTIMENGYGRLDLYGGNSEKMHYTLIRLSAMSEKGNYMIYPGHGGAVKLSDAIYNIYNH